MFNSGYMITHDLIQFLLYVVSSISMFEQYHKYLFNMNNHLPPACVNHANQITMELQLHHAHLFMSIIIIRCFFHNIEKSRIAMKIDQIYLFLQLVIELYINYH